MGMRALLVGCGAMSRRWLDAAARIDGLTVAGLLDIDPARARERAAEFGLAEAWTGSDLTQALATVRPDVVFDVVVPEARFGVVMQAFRAGCHVLSEKPMADSLDRAREMIAAARAAGVIHAVVQNRRYIDGIRRLRTAVAGGGIGEVTSVHTDFFLAPRFGGFREEMRNVLLLDMAIHTFDAARYVVGGEPVAVYCHEENPKGSWYAHGASAYAIFEFDSGATYTYRGSWCAQGLRTSWESAWRIVGSAGTLTWDGHDRFAAEREGTTAQGVLRDGVPIDVPPADPALRIGGHEGVMRDFVAAVRSGVPPETAGQHNVRSLAMVFAAIESARERRRVEIAPAGA
ncbi:Gfo/Idh/MocA family oxidoreductase [uncultured Alsobacter sp.]|uniref:Gfo/Idh/MocA family protein n=1 Tax=uncultured Alsobacter sp. TaxID=1748258 RepID=UPI0025FEBBFC|nr:Gfo/Idh/MocA family oxidoreductase [uncultured Alsobacter sp.]